MNSIVDFQQVKKGSDPWMHIGTTYLAWIIAKKVGMEDKKELRW